MPEIWGYSNFRGAAFGEERAYVTVGRRLFPGCQMKRLATLFDRQLLAQVSLLLMLGLGNAMAQGQYAKIEIVVKHKKFEPAEVKAPANARIVIQVKNDDAVAMEFESKSLKVENDPRGPAPQLEERKDGDLRVLTYKIDQSPPLKVEPDAVAARRSP